MCRRVTEPSFRLGPVYRQSSVSQKVLYFYSHINILSSYLSHQISGAFRPKYRRPVCGRVTKPSIRVGPVCRQSGMSQ